MDSTESPKSTALVTLLNEIEMLLSELRSVESHVRGAQALTAERIAQLQADHQRELALLRSAILGLEQANDIQEIARKAQSEMLQPLDLVNEQTVTGTAAEAAAETGSSEAESRLRQLVTAVDQLQRENTTLRCRLAELEVIGPDAWRRTVDAQKHIEPKDRFVRTSGSAETATELNEVIPNEEHVAMKSDEHDPDSTGATGHQKAASPSEAEQNLRDEIIRLRQEAQERNQILQNRNDELVSVKLQLDQLQERMAQLESSLPDESSADRMRTEFQAQLALLQAELSQKEWALEERQAEACNRELQLRQQITALRQQLISTHREREQRDLIFGEGGSDLAEKDLAPNNGEGEPARATFAGRRWNSGLGRKRRWRS